MTDQVAGQPHVHPAAAADRPSLRLRRLIPFGAALCSATQAHTRLADPQTAAGPQSHLLPLTEVADRHSRQPVSLLGQHLPAAKTDRVESTTTSRCPSLASVSSHTPRFRYCARVRKIRQRMKPARVFAVEVPCHLHRSIEFVATPSLLKEGDRCRSNARLDVQLLEEYAISHL